MGNPIGKKGGGGGGGDMMLESRHLIGIFLGLVVICGVFFTLGYVMGRTQLETTVRAAGVTRPPEVATGSSPMEPTKPAGKTAPAVPAPTPWSFPTTDTKKGNDRLEPPPPKSASRTGDVKVALNSAPSTAKPAPVSTAPSTTASKQKAPVIPRGAAVLQVAALTKESDAYALASALQQKKFPAFVLPPAGDSYYRVQVGPYPSAAAADTGKKALVKEGFKAILKK